jgi:site-specific DNA-cytosine methylase
LNPDASRNSCNIEEGPDVMATALDSVAVASTLVGDRIDCVSEFSGIGALEHGLQAGFEEVGMRLRLLQFSEIDTTREGRHNAAVLRKRFPHCVVITPTTRETTPIPRSVRMVDVTALCQNHSLWSSARSPWETEELLLPVIRRLSLAPWVEAVLMENVIEFAQLLDGQGRSSLSWWIAELTACGSLIEPRLATD